MLRVVVHETARGPVAVYEELEKSCDSTRRQVAHSFRLDSALNRTTPLPPQSASQRASTPGYGRQALKQCQSSPLRIHTVLWLLVIADLKARNEQLDTRELLD